MIDLLGILGATGFLALAIGALHLKNRATEIGMPFILSESEVR